MENRITIAGGGLAGLALGIALRLRGVEVELHEALAYPRHRVCGEFVSGVESPTLSRLGIAECLADAEKLGSAEWSDASGRLGSLMVSGLGISRWRLDERLQRRFRELGGRLATGSRIAPAEGVVWCAGRPRREGPWIGLKCHARGLALSADLEMFTGTNGYLGLARIEDGLVNICGLFRRSEARGAKGAALLIAAVRAGGLEGLARRLESAGLDESSFCGVAGFRTGHQRGPEFSIGDAAWMIPPFTGNGMSMAFESAECALGPALDYASGKKSWGEAAKDCARAQRRRFRRRMVAAVAMHWFLTNRAGRGLASVFGRARAIPFETLLKTVR